MRRILLALVSLLMVLFTLYTVALPASAPLVHPQDVGPFSGEWAQTLASEFQEGELAGTEITQVEDGEVRLACEAEGYRGQGLYTSGVKEAPFLFNAIGSHWVAHLPPETGLQLEVRSSEDGVYWSDWWKVELDEDLYGESGEDWGGLILVPPSKFLQYRLSLSTEDIAVSPALEEITLLYINSQEGPTVEEAKSMVLPQEVTSGVPQPPIISRAGWGANESWSSLEPEYENPQEFVIHHTATKNFTADPAATVRAVYYYHGVTLGWGDIGYNFLIDWQGNIYEGRKGGDGVVGAHARRYNYGSIGIACIGDFNVADVTPEMEQALVGLIAWEADRFGIDPQETSYFIDRELPNMVGHRDLLQTSCPGERLYRRLPEIRELAWQKLLKYAPRLTLEAPDEGDAVAGEVALRAATTSPASLGLEFQIDGEGAAQGPSPLEWSWDTQGYPDGEHILLALAQGAGGHNTELSRTLQVDNTPPTGTLTVGEGIQFTSQPTVTLTLEAEDEGSGVASIRFTQGEEFTPWEEFASSKEWVLLSQEGDQTFGVQFQDGVGNTSPVYTSSVVLDMTPPGDWSDFTAWSLSRAMVRVEDELSGIDGDTAEYSLSPDGQSWGEWQPAAASGGGATYTLTVRDSLGRGWIRFRVKDLAGNEGESHAYVLAEAPTPTPVPEPQEGPDLVVKSLSISPKEPQAGEPVTVTVAIANLGDLSTGGGFWTELYIDPQEVPTINSVSTELGDGAFWYTQELMASQVITLTTQEAEGRYSDFSGTLSPGSHRLYAYVDAYNPEVEEGLVVEKEEGNNLFGPLLVEVEGEASSSEEPLPIFLKDLWEGLYHWLLRVSERFIA